MIGSKRTVNFHDRIKEHSLFVTSIEGIFTFYGRIKKLSLSMTILERTFYERTKRALIFYGKTEKKLSLFMTSFEITFIFDMTGQDQKGI